jgi:hypothetical protein
MIVVCLIVMLIVAITFRAHHSALDQCAAAGGVYRCQTRVETHDYDGLPTTSEYTRCACEREGGE